MSKHNIPIYSSSSEVFSQNDEGLVTEATIKLYELDSPSTTPALSRFRNGVRSVVFALLRILSGIGKARPVTRPEDLKRVLIFRYDAIGDYIVSSPFISWLKEINPSVEIDVVASYRNENIVRSDPNISSVTAIHPRVGMHRSWLEVRRHCKKRPPDMIAALVFTHMTKAAFLAMAAGGNATRLTMEHADRSKIYGRVFDRQVKHPSGREHWIKTMAMVGPRAFNTPDLNAAPYLVIEPEALETVKRALSVHGVGETDGRPYFVFNASGSNEDRCFTVERAASICAHLLSVKPDHSVVVTSGPDKHDLVAAVVKEVNDDRCFEWMGPLNELVPCIAGASMVITPDTATVHIAATAGVPVVAFYITLMSVAEWHPFGVPYRAILTPDPSTINAIELDVIHGALDSLISEAL